MEKNFKIGNSLLGQNYEYGKGRISLKEVTWTMPDVP